MANPTAVLRFFDDRHPLFQRRERIVPLADRIRAAEPMSVTEMRSRAGAVWRTIDGETDAPRRETQAKAARLSYVGRDIQQALTARARLIAVWEVIRYLVAVLHRSSNLGFAR